jgi:S-adenosylhomocysteine hydrolase
MIEISVIQKHTIYKNEIKKMPIHQSLISEYTKYDFSQWEIGIAHVFAPNTLPMLVALATTNADLTIILENGNAYDKQTIEIMKDAGFKIELSANQQYDFVIDCGGYFAGRTPRLGSVEVTRSGIHKYSDLDTIDFRLLDADNTKSKLIETFLGNPEAVERTFGLFIDQHLEYLENKLFAIIGFGKIGRGLAARFRRHGEVLIVDINPQILDKASSLGYNTYLMTNSKEMNSDKLANYDIIFTATGHPAIGSNYFLKYKLANSLKINIGAVDEWGDQYTDQDVFHSKFIPFNFNLTPPTDSRYIDPILAAQLEGLRFLIENNQNLQKGYIQFPAAIDNKITNEYQKYWNADLSILTRYFDI